MSGSVGAAGGKREGVADLLFEQELNEVYLLLDYVSGQPQRHLSELDDKIPDPGGDKVAPRLTSGEIIKRVSRIRYPPTGDEPKRSEDAALLVLLKDELNSLTYPARGQTIAFTTIFSEQGNGPKIGRLRAAELAFPGLVGSAYDLRSIKSLLSWGGLIIAVISAVFLWQVSYGVQLAARFDEARRADAESASRIFDMMEKQPDKFQDIDLPKLCRINSQQTFFTDKRIPAIQRLCNEFVYRHAQYCVAIADVAKFADSWMFTTINWFTPSHTLEISEECGAAGSEKSAASAPTKVAAAGATGTNTSGSGPGTSSQTDNTQGNAAPSKKRGRQEDAQSIAGVLAMMSNYILPILFGLVGTIASLVRGIQDKVRDSVLSPRDRALSLIRLPLGVMAGVSVGLFFNPANVAQNTGSIGAFTVSASGIAFLAGYGAEGFFRALDGFISRLFSLDETARPSKPAPPR